MAVDGVGRFTLLVFSVLSNWTAVFKSRGRLAEQMAFVGVTSLPLIVLTGLFVWLKLTEEADEEALELEAEAV